MKIVLYSTHYGDPHNTAHTFLNSNYRLTFIGGMPSTVLKNTSCWTSLNWDKAANILRPPMWSRGNIIASHQAGPGIVLGQFPGLGFSSTLRKKSENLGHICPLVSFGHHQNVLPKGRSFTANSSTKAAVLPELGNQGCSFARDE